MKRLLLMPALCLAMVGCNKNSSSNNSNPIVRNTNFTGISAYVTIRNECASSTATVSLLSAYGSQAYAPISVPSGGVADFNVAGGQYTLRVQAGNCMVSGTVAASTYPPPAIFDVCLGQTCQTSPYKTTMLASQKSAVTSEAPCSWGVYGCLSNAHKGTGGVTITRAAMTVSGAEASKVDLNLGYSSGNETFISVPGLIDSGWKTQLVGGKIRVNNVDYDRLVYHAQVDEKLLQFTSGFCESRTGVVAKMVQYLEASGYGSASVADFRSAWENQMPPNEELCVYPQTETEIRDVVNVRGNVALNARRTWFVMVPKLDQAVSKVRDFSSRFAAFKTMKPKTDALAVLKKDASKTRSVANDGILVEEAAVGFLLER